MSVEVPCSQCGAAVAVREDEGFTSCPHCDGTLYVDVRATTRHTYLEPVLTEGRLDALCRRWLDRQEATGPFRLHGVKRRYAPYWVASCSAERRVVPAFASGFPGLHKLDVPAGRQQPFPESLRASDEVIWPTITAESALAGGTADDLRLVHVPVFLATLEYGSQRWPICLDAQEGAIFSFKSAPPDTAALDVHTALILGGITLIFLLEGVWVDGFWLTLLVYGVTAGVLTSVLYGFQRELS